MVGENHIFSSEGALVFYLTASWKALLSCSEIYCPSPPLDAVCPPFFIFRKTLNLPARLTDFISSGLTENLRGSVRMRWLWRVGGVIQEAQNITSGLCNGLQSCCKLQKLYFVRGADELTPKRELFCSNCGSKKDAPQMLTKGVQKIKTNRHISFLRSSSRLRSCKWFDSDISWKHAWACPQILTGYIKQGCDSVCRGRAIVPQPPHNQCFYLRFLSKKKS